MSPWETQTYYRLRVVQVYEGYRFTPEHAERWRKLLNDSSASIYGRMCAARFLLEVNDQRAQAFLDEQLASRDTRLSFNAAYALIDCAREHGTPPWVVKRIIALVQDPRFRCEVDYGERICGDYRMNHIPRDQEYPEGDYDDGLVEPLGDLCLALGWAKSQEAVPVLIRLLEKYPETERAALALGWIGDPRGGPAILKALPQRHNNEHLYFSALADLRYKPAAPVLADRLRTAPASDFSEWYTWGRLIETLAALRDPKSGTAIESRYADFPDELKATARRALAFLQHDDPVPALLELLAKEPDDGAITMINWDLARLKDPRATQPLFDLARSSESGSVCNSAVVALGAIRTREALLSLVSLLGMDWQRQMRAELWKISAEGLPAFILGQIISQLKDATGQDFGQDAAAWRGWIQANSPTTRPSAASQDAH